MGTQPQGRGTLHTHTHQHASDKHKHTMPRDNQDNRNRKDVLQSCISRGDHTSSTHSLIIRNKRSPKTGKETQQDPLGGHSSPNRSHEPVQHLFVRTRSGSSTLASIDINVQLPQPNRQSSAATIRTRPGADAHAKLDSPNETVQRDGRSPRNTNAAPNTRRQQGAARH